MVRRFTWNIDNYLPALNGDVSNLRAIKEREKNFKRPEE